MKTIKVWYKLVTIIKVTEGGKKVIKNGKKKTHKVTKLTKNVKHIPKMADNTICDIFNRPGVPLV